ncbi:hypothetical protein [Halobaculum sp. EA56]
MPLLDSDPPATGQPRRLLHADADRDRREPVDGGQAVLVYRL